MLYLVATPIGNLEDMSYRAVKTLGECDEILCEDTRHSRILLNHYNINRPLKSYHKFNEAKELESILQKLKGGKNLALISDAGTPGISDPGERLVKACVLEGIQVVAIPGACAAICALSCSGLTTEKFQFLGFLPKKETELKEALIKAIIYPGTTLCYESPHRLIEVLERLKQLDSSANVLIARELTKKFEEIKRGTPEHLLQHWKNNPLKGEIVLMIEGGKIAEIDMSPEEKVVWMEETFGVSRKDSIKLVAEIWGLSKREVYKKMV